MWLTVTRSSSQCGVFAGNVLCFKPKSNDIHNMCARIHWNIRLCQHVFVYESEFVSVYVCMRTHKMWEHHHRILCSSNCSYNKWRCSQRTVKYTTVHAYARTHIHTSIHTYREREIWDGTMKRDGERERMSERISKSELTGECWKMSARKIWQIFKVQQLKKERKTIAVCVCASLTVVIILHKRPDWAKNKYTKKNQKIKQHAHAISQITR